MQRDYPVQASQPCCLIGNEFRSRIGSAFCFVVSLSMVTGCQPEITSPPDGARIPCDCQGPCGFEVEGTLPFPLGLNEELYLVVSPVDAAAPRCFVQFGDKTIQGTLWTAKAQIGSDDFPPQDGDVFRVWAIVVNLSVAGPPPVGALPSLSLQSIPGLVGVSNPHTYSVVCCGVEEPPVLRALRTCRYWHLYSPFRNAAGTSVDESQIRRELQILYEAGARGLVTYEMMNGIEEAPRIAKEIGFEWVIAGIYWWTNGVVNGQTESTLAMEKANLAQEIQYVDAIVVGNEGLVDSDTWNQPRYTIEDLERELCLLQSTYGLPVTTAEGPDVYDEYCQLVTGSCTDFICPNIHPWLGGFRDPCEGANDVDRVIKEGCLGMRDDKLLVLHECWWPSETEEQTEEAQRQFFECLLQTEIPFLWGETFDQPWKPTAESPAGGHWGLWHYDEFTDTYQPKLVVGLVETSSQCTLPAECY